MFTNQSEVSFCAFSYLIFPERSTRPASDRMDLTFHPELGTRISMARPTSYAHVGVGGIVSDLQLLCLRMGEQKITEF